MGRLRLGRSVRGLAVGADGARQLNWRVMKAGCQVVRVI